MSRPSVCLNMIVKNEFHIIQECFDAVAPYIDYWVIVDTGSTDGTQDFIKSYMDKLKIPGELHERPWVNFGHNRTEALELAKDHCDYLFIMDADDTIEGKIDLTNLSHDAYEVKMKDDGDNAYYTRKLIVKNDLPWKFVGMVHEYITHDAYDHSLESPVLLGDYYVISRRLGDRNKDQTDKLNKDIELLLKEIEEQPNNLRPVYYLANTYLALKKYQDALDSYEKRIAMGGWHEEIYVSYLRSAICIENLQRGWPEVLAKCLEAWDFRPTRIESLLFVADHYKKNNNPYLAYLFAEKAAQAPLPKDLLFVEIEYYTWRALDEFAICAANLGKFDKANKIYDYILSQDFITDAERPRVKDNKIQIEAEVQVEADNEFRLSLAESVL